MKSMIAEQILWIRYGEEPSVDPDLEAEVPMEDGRISGARNSPLHWWDGSALSAESFRMERTCSNVPTWRSLSHSLQASGNDDKMSSDVGVGTAMCA